MSSRRDVLTRLSSLSTSLNRDPASAVQAADEKSVVAFNLALQDAYACLFGVPILVTPAKQDVTSYGDLERKSARLQKLLDNPPQVLTFNPDQAADIPEALTSQVRVIRLQPGIFYFDGTLVPSSQQIIQGSGMGVTILWLRKTGQFIQWRNKSRFTIRDCTIVGSDGHLLHIIKDDTDSDWVHGHPLDADTIVPNEYPLFENLILTWHSPIVPVSFAYNTDPVSGVFLENRASDNLDTSIYYPHFSNVNVDGGDNGEGNQPSPNGVRWFGMRIGSNATNNAPTQVISCNIIGGSLRRLTRGIQFGRASGGTVLGTSFDQITDVALDFGAGSGDVHAFGVRIENDGSTAPTMHTVVFETGNPASGNNKVWSTTASACAGVLDHENGLTGNSVSL